MTLFSQYSDHRVPTLLQNPTKSYKMTMPHIFSHNHRLNCLKMPYLLQSPTFFLFSWVKIYFYKYFLGPWSRKIVTSLIYLILGTSQWSVPLFPWVKMSWSFFVLLLEALLCTTRQPFWVQNSALLVTGLHYISVVT